MSKNKTRDDEYQFRDKLSYLLEEQDNELRRGNGNQGRDDRRYQNDNRDRNHDNNNRDNRDNRNGNWNGNNQNNNQRQNENNNNNNQNQREKNPLCRLLNNDGRVYSREEILRMLVEKDGLAIMVKDLKAAKKNPENQQYAKYVQQLLKDVVFASAIVEAIDEIFGKKFESDMFSKKEMSLVMSEIYICLNSSFDKDSSKNYDEDIIQSMRDSYRDILYRFNKKKAKKLREEIKGIDQYAKQIAIITSGQNATSVYRLMSFLYKNADNEEFFKCNSKTIKKIFKICYEKRLDEAIKDLMLERAMQPDGMSENAIELYGAADLMVRDYLENSDEEIVAKIVKSYVNERRRHEGQNPTKPRRFGSVKTIHPDDYPKLVKTISRLEKKDFSMIPFLR